MTYMTSEIIFAANVMETVCKKAGLINESLDGLWEL